ncbi:uncharacterized protein LOC116852549 isoform X2 [Odontomachus brunneus]|uniref:uncharacterized protein LOC116852549 isoform X2 n=1 Tax=Odontomachus brunneus TaxID=486640 RepID=UPI0013F243E3|nr:uncharacterized protein LOC116852549 isoform X2 [Odontomachus brunneus]
MDECEIYCTMCVYLLGCIQDTDCSGRTLATVMVAWIAVLIVTSILLKWEYTWIVVTILTLLFLLICVWMAYHIKRAQQRTWFEEYQRRTDYENERRERNIWTISGITVDNCGERESQRIVDPPPSYSSVIPTVQSTSESSRPSLTIGNLPNDSKCEDPPPYSSVICSTDTRDRNAEAANEPNTISSATATKNNSTIDMSRTQDTRMTDD